MNQVGLYSVKLLERQEIADNTIELSFDLGDQALAFSPGQYVRLTIPGLKGDARGSSRDLSIVSSPNENHKITVAFRISNSAFKQAFLRMKIDTAVTVRGPLGAFTLPDIATNTPLVFIAGGIGITPFISMLRLVTVNKLAYKIHLIYANTDTEKAAYNQELRTLAEQNPNFTFVDVVGQIDKSSVLNNVTDSPATLWYVCGQPDMVTQVRQILAEEVGVAQERIKFEDYIGYGDATKTYRVLAPSLKKSLQLDENMSNTLLQTIGMAALISMTDIEGNIIYANAMFEKISQYSIAELLGQNHRILKSGYHEPALYQQLWATISAGKTWRGEIKNKAKDGTFYWDDSVISPIFGEDGKPYQYLAIRFPITERKEAEASLAKQSTTSNEQLRTLQLQNKVNEDTKLAMLNVLEDAQELQKELQKFKLATDSAYEHIVITDDKGVILYANVGAERNTGFSAEEMVGKTTALWGGQMDKDYYQDMWQTLTVKKLPFVSDITNKRKNGELYTSQLNISPILDTNGDIIFFVSLENDITIERNLTEALKQEKASVEKKVVEKTKQLREEQARLTASINSLDIGFLMTFLSSDKISYNQALLNILDLKDAPVLASGASLTLDMIRQRLGNDYLAEAINKSRQADATMSTKEITLGNKILSISNGPIISRDKQIIGSIVLFKDITEERTLERSKDEFFSIASHELRTPLTSIRGNTSMILDYYQEALKDPQLHEMVTDVHDSSIRLIEIVNDFLDLSRLEQGKMTFNYETVSTEEIIESVAYEMKAVLDEKQLNLNLDNKTLDVLPKVWVDKNRLKQVAYNLIGNAAKFTDKGSITVSAAIENNFVKVLVTDTGSGMPAEAQRLLFHKFQQAGNSLLTRDTTHGTGLGLYISKMIIESMGGTIKLEQSIEGQGSTFSFTVPITTPEHQAATKHADIHTDTTTGLTTIEA